MGFRTAEPDFNPRGACVVVQERDLTLTNRSIAVSQDRRTEWRLRKYPSDSMVSDACYWAPRWRSRPATKNAVTYLENAPIARAESSRGPLP